MRLNRFRSLLVLCCVATATAGSARAQLVNRAIWLGFEEEGFRRDYAQDAEYFVDRATIVDAPPWWRDETLDPFRSRIAIAGGSVSSRELTFENSTVLGIDLGRGGTFRFQQVGSENQTTRYQRFAAGLDLAIDERSAFWFQLEGTADKARADFSLGAELWRTETSAHRFGLTFADWSDGKSDFFEYDTKPYGLMATGYFGGTDQVQLAYDVSTQLPLEERNLVDGSVFELERTLGQLELRVPISERDRLVFTVDGESNRKENVTVDPLDLARETGSVDRIRLRTEWWRRNPKGRDWSVGFWLHALDEDNRTPNDPALDRRVRRREAVLLGRTAVPLNEAWTIEPYLYAGYVDLEDTVGGVDSLVEFDEFQGKAGVPFLYRFSESAFLRIDLSTQLDEFAFGGGAVQFQATF